MTSGSNSDSAFRMTTPRQLEVLRVIRDHGVITRAEIAEVLQSSASQVSRLTAPLISRHLVTVEPRLPLVEGRPTELLTLADHTHYVVGIDIGKTTFHVIGLDKRGRIAVRQKFTRRAIEQWFANLPKCLICSASA